MYRDMLMFKPYFKDKKTIINPVEFYNKIIELMQKRNIQAHKAHLKRIFQGELYF
jgi:cobalamin biosynthesis protein CobD/CbiB